MNPHRSLGDAGLRRAVGWWLSAIVLASAPRAVSAQQFDPPRVLRADSTRLEVGAGTLGFQVSPVPAADGTRRVTVRLLLASGDQMQLLWEGNPFQRPRWDGRVDGRIVTPGTYDLVGEVVVDGVTQRVRRPIAVDVAAAVPGPPILLPEVDTMRVRDVQAEERRSRRAFVTIGTGAVLAIASSSLVADAIRMSPPNSSLRSGVAGGYLGGLALMAWGGFSLFRGSSSPITRPVEVPIEANIRRNRTARLAAQRRVVTLTFLDEGGR